jgi:hypothetical protein
VPAELGRDFSLDRALRFDSLPAIWEAADARGGLDDCAQAYVQEEIRGDAAVRNGDRTFRTDEGVDVVPLAEWFDAVATARVWP